jgi:adenylate cyclase class IV
VGRNVEIKARLTDSSSARSRAAAIADGPPELIEQHDTFFCCPHGRLKLRRFSGGRGELIFYTRHDGPGPTESRYHISPTAHPDSLLETLSAAYGIKGVVRKRRVLYLTGQTRIHLDEVDRLGDFLELEVVLGDDQTVSEGERVARDLMARLGIADHDLLPVAYVDLLEERPSATGR